MSGPGEIRTCSCGVQFRLRFHERTQNTAPIEVDPDPRGNILINDDGTWHQLRKAEQPWPAERYLNHFAYCPNRKQYERKTAR